MTRLAVGAMAVLTVLDLLSPATRHGASLLLGALVSAGAVLSTRRMVGGSILAAVALCGLCLIDPATVGLAHYGCLLTITICVSRASWLLAAVDTVALGGLAVWICAARAPGTESAIQLVWVVALLGAWAVGLALHAHANRPATAGDARD